MKYLMLLFLSSFMAAMEPTINNKMSEYQTLPDRSEDMPFLKYLRLRFASDNAYYVKNTTLVSSPPLTKEIEKKDKKSINNFRFRKYLKNHQFFLSNNIFYS
jgi:hypothetical protein